MKPSDTPSSQPSETPSSLPSETPSSQPSETPSSLPSSQPSSVPSSAPSSQPSTEPSSGPSESPSGNPSSAPSSIPSVSPSSIPSSEPSSMPSCTPTDSPTPPEETFLFYPVWASGSEGCLNDGNEPSYMSANPADYMSSTLDKCCNTFFGWNYDMYVLSIEVNASVSRGSVFEANNSPPLSHSCMGLLDDSCARALWYPDWDGENVGCTKDGEEPYYMTSNPMSYLFAQRSDCCSEHYEW
ncbi:predicted protein [Thalassiosira pseudonana CCMP1335]|uniref:Uncharacterized protein n=1 Tax=Thalassiosira pseudonana TaxID=35128 RepID=B8LE66_THAPS|nr:predicted protein [Thalassiosira pseudonana CCMP1335]EED86394.1 predicted protein [Thalassiosira pseudonana CCMP1335]